MGDLVNPYIAGAPVTEQRMFFGREDIFQWIENSITGQYADHILVIHGQRRVGKTSVLKQLGNRLPQRYIPVFFDLQGRTHTTLDRFLWWLAREIVRVLKQDHDIDLPIPDRDDFTRDVEFFENRFLPDLKPVLTDKTLLLTFDEFDNLEESEVKEELARPLVDYLRRLMGYANLNFIFSIGSSGRKLENMQAAYTEFFKSALYKKISFLNEEQTRHLITRPVEGLLRYDDKAVERIFSLASGHPYFTQLTCHELFARCQRTKQRHIAVEDVEAVLDDVIERGTVNLKFVWDEASDIEKWSLAGLADLDQADSRALADYLRRNRVRFSESDLTSGLLHLREKDILTFDNSFVIQLMRRWLQKNRPIEQVREELTEVNPIANRYIEIGLEFKDASLFDKAIESFHQALEIANDNIQAQVNIALTYMDQKLYGKAVVEFEKTLALDDEDVSARAGLCEAHLALGDLALTRGRERDAALSYQRVLAINAEHTEARGRMADIARQRAEKALTDGKDEEAFSAFAEALKYTPEDEALSIRFEEVKKERREKVLSTLLARAEKELTAKNWDSAIRILQEGLQLSAEDERFKKRIATAKENQRAAKLESCLARASHAEQAGKWEAAAAALQEYLSIEADQPQVQGRLEKARGKIREIELSELRERARSFARSERWDESLTAWDAVLVQEPTDLLARSEREAVEKSRGLSKSYAEAQSAFAKKDYDKAIALFKNIVMEDSDYKEATRLLAESVELRRTVRKWWQSRWALGGVAIITLLIGAWLLVRFGLPLFTAQPASPIGSEPAIANPLPASPPSVTLVPTASPTPLPLKWTRLNSGQFLPRMNVKAIVVDPADSGVIYVGTETSGIYKSIDGGISWQPSHKGLEQASIAKLVIDPQDSNILYVSSANGIYKTIDGGRNWNLLYPIEGSRNLTMDSQNHEHLYFVDGDFYRESNYLYQTMNGGETWDKLQTPTCPSSFANLNLLPENADTLFLTFTSYFEINECNQGVYISENGGQTWNFTPANLEGIDQLRILNIQTQPVEIIYRSIRISEQSFILYKSLDRGQTWSLILNNRCFAITIDPTNPEKLFCGADGQLMLTEDGGKTWSSALETDGWLVAIAFSSNAIFVGEMMGNGLYISDDGGREWKEQNSGMGGIYFNLHVNFAQSSNWYAEEEAGVFHSSDLGQTWDLVDDRGWLTALGSDGNTIYRLGGNGILRSKDAGKTWVELALPSKDTVSGIATLSQQPETVLALRRNGYYISTDGGATWDASFENAWEQIPFDGTSNPKLYSDSTRQQFYVIGTNGNTEFLHSEDGGRKWDICAPIDASFMFSSSNLSIDPMDKQRLIVATERGVFFSTDGCRSWRAINDGLKSLYVNSVAIDPNKPDTLYTGTDSGAYVSFNGGETWNEVNDGLLGATVVYSIAVDKESNVYAATPYGIFKLEGK